MPIVQNAHNYVFDLLKSCQEYPYHNPSHTQWVFDRATFLGMSEWVAWEDLEDLQLACLFHDTGFTEQYEKNEFIWARIARSWLTLNMHDEKRIEKIEGIIMATVLFSRPKNILEEIIQDADLDNIGTREEFYFSLDYLNELRSIGKVNISDNAYWQFTYTLLCRFKFHTKTARKQRKDQQSKNIEHLAKFLDMIGCEIPVMDNQRMNDIQ